MSAPGRRGVLSRADLVAALAAAGGGRPDATTRHLAAALGLEWEPPPLDAPPPPEPPPQGDPPPAPPPELAVLDSPLLDAWFWRAETLEWFDPEEAREEPPVDLIYRGWRTRPSGPPPFQPLATWAELVPRLRQALGGHSEGWAIDLDLTVRRIGQGRLLDRFPRERRRRWGAAFLLIEDNSRRLIPYRTDQRRVRHALRRLLPGHGLVRAAMDEFRVRPELPDAADGWPPPPGTRVLVLGDLGCLARQGAGLSRVWLELGRELRDAGCQPLALLPAPLSRCPPELAAVWRLIPWERPRPAHDGLSLEDRAERLLRLAANASRIEPGLLRSLRLLLPADQADAGTEADVWQHPDVAGDSAVAGCLEPDRARVWREAFAAELALAGEGGEAWRRRVARAIEAWRGDLPEEIWFEELLNLSPASGPGADGEDWAATLAEARAYFAAFCADHRQTPAGIPGHDRAWLGRVMARSTKALLNEDRIGVRLLALAGELGLIESLPAGIDVCQVPAGNRPEETALLLQSGAALRLQPAGTPCLPGSPLALLQTRNGLVDIVPDDIATPEAGPIGDDFWETGAPPPWADIWGRDEFGAWVEFSVAGKGSARVTQRMRWIEPGSFWMGSPDDEPERHEDEGPRHEVTLREGYWLFDTACTQALWAAVMQQNPSRFQWPDRPVEQVSWDDAWRFIETLNVLKPGLDLVLPSEARWEYACRAGTETPFSFGATITPAQVNYNGDYPYAGGPQGKFRQRTVPVKSLPPNAWGLYEMHGNVSEWVQDAWHDHYRGAPVDGSAWDSDMTGADRVMRGGSWGHFARYCRSANRRRFARDNRDYVLGFRCARVQPRESGRPAGASGARVAGAVAWSGARPEGRLLRLGSAEAVILPGAGTTRPSPERGGADTLFVTTDRQRLTLRRAPKPAWARAMGRDRYGLWAEIAVEPKAGGMPAIQRLRWIPPGRFRMGSPDDEPGRYDDEGPQQTITLATGYWLFDTPCTQALWVALLGDNPSRFQDPRRPVEQVRWREVHDRFLPALNARFQALQTDDAGRFVLPSEAQWEYACRAGTKTALYTGPIDILGGRNAPALDAIAWYWANSAMDFELDKIQYDNRREELRYLGTKRGTHPLKVKAANPWGLFDMLGNVWEWTEDAWHDSHAGAHADGRPRAGTARAGTAGADRVIRGGSWYDLARNCRSAVRGRGAPVKRDFDLGFRCARVQA